MDVLLVIWAQCAPPCLYFMEKKYKENSNIWKWTARWGNFPPKAWEFTTTYSMGRSRGLNSKIRPCVENFFSCIPLELNPNSKKIKHPANSPSTLHKWYIKYLPAHIHVHPSSCSTKRYARKILYTGSNFRVKASGPPHILYVVVNSHALGGKFSHLAVHFQIFVFYFIFPWSIHARGSTLCPDN